MNEMDPALSQEGTELESDPVDLPTEEQAEEEVENTESKGSVNGEGDAPQNDQEAEANAEEIQLVVEGEESPQTRNAAPGWVRDLREQHRNLKAQNAELERKLRAVEEANKPAGPAVKPTLDGCDYDPVRFERELEAWQTRQQEVSRKEAEAQADEARRRGEWNTRLENYGKQKDELSKQIPSFSEAEVAVQSILDITQQGVIVGAADNPAMVVCALGQNPKLAQDLASEHDPIKFAVKMAKLEARLKMAKRTNAPPPERPVKGTGSVSGTVDSNLERLRTEAARTGDYSKVHAYKQRKTRK